MHGLRIVDGVGQPTMQLPELAGVQQVQRGRRQEWVTEGDPVRCDPHYVGPHCFVESALHAQGRQKLRSRSARRSHRGSGPSRGCAEPGQSLRGEGGKALRNPKDRAAAVQGCGSSQFDREVRVAAGGLGDPREGRAAHRFTEFPFHDVEQGGGRHALQRNMFSPEGALGRAAQLGAGRARRAPGHQQPERAAGDPAHREDERSVARRINPLLVVNHEQHRSIRHPCSEQGRQTRADRAEVRRTVRDRFAKCRHQKRVPLGIGQPIQRVVAELSQQIGQDRETQVPFGCARVRGQHADARGRGNHPGMTDQGRLSDPGFALEHQDGYVGGGSSQEGLEDDLFRIAAYRAVHGLTLGRHGRTEALSYAAAQPPLRRRMQGIGKHPMRRAVLVSSVGS